MKHILTVQKTCIWANLNTVLDSDMRCLQQGAASGQPLSFFAWILATTHCSMVFLTGVTFSHEQQAHVPSNR